MHDSHFVVRRSGGGMEILSPERLRAMKTSAQRAVSGRGASAPSSSATPGSTAKSTCLCAPTTHPGSFRCRMHRTQSAAPSSRQCVDQSRARSIPKPQQLAAQSVTPPSTTHRTCSRCLVRGPSRLSRVVYATGMEESLCNEEPEIVTIPIPLPIVRLSNSSVHSRGISSAAIGARFCALRRLQGSGKDDIYRIVRPTNPRPILLST